MIELPDLFHENRVAELSFSLLLYAPIGLCLVLIRLVALSILFFISQLIPKSPSFDQFLNEAISFILTLTYVDDNVQPERKTTKIIVANHVSYFDGIFLRKYFSNNRNKVISFSEDNPLMNLFKLNSNDLLKKKDDLLDFYVNEIQQSNCQLIFLPECIPTTGSDGLLRFNLLPFTLAKKVQLPILPICLRTTRLFQIRTTTFNSHSYGDVFWFLFSPSTQFTINFLPAVAPNDLTSDENLCEQIREHIARKLNIELTQFDEPEVRQLKSRRDLLKQRHEQRRVEFEQMVRSIQQQIPTASIEAIRHDLGETKNMQKTIANLNERAAAAAAAAAAHAASKPTISAATSSNAMRNSSSSGNYRQTYERLKQELIEKNRQLFLQKNCS